MIPKEAIQKAMNGGWNPESISCHNEKNFACFNAIALDPSFWQALGKALGWWPEPIHGAPDCWKDYAERFHDLILTSGNTKAFWQELLDQRRTI